MRQCNECQIGCAQVDVGKRENNPVLLSEASCPKATTKRRIKFKNAIGKVTIDYPALNNPILGWFLKYT